MNPGSPIAHIRKNPISGEFEFHDLQEHLEGTAEMAARFAGEFSNESWGKLIGLWHDLGKYSYSKLQRI